MRISPSNYEEYRPISTDTDVIATETVQRESACVSRKTRVDACGGLFQNHRQDIGL
jgi:hypothetical protein